MSCVLQHNAYGKSRVRLSKIIRHKDRHEIKEITIDVQLEGAFQDTYLSGDNKDVVATDSMKNTVYVLAAENDFADIETFGKTLAQHFVRTYAQVQLATVWLREDVWNRIVTGGREHRHSFVSGGNEKRVAMVRATTDKVEIESGIEGLNVVKTTDSEFWGFVRDQYTTLPEVRDRIFGTSVSAHWTYTTDKPNYNETYTKARQLFLEVFAEHKSLAVQQTMYEMGKRALDAMKDIEEIRLSMPNQHRIPFDLTRFGKENKNEIFITTDEPFGLICATVARTKRELASSGARYGKMTASGS